MFCDGGEGDLERCGELIDGAFAGSELGEDRAAGGVSEGGEGGGELVGHLSVWLINLLV